MTGPTDALVSGRFRAARIVHASMILSVLTYAVVAHVLREMAGWRAPARSDQLDALRWVLFVVAVGLLAGVLALKPRLLSAEGLAEIARNAGAEVALDRLQSRTVVLLAAAEGPALLGLVLFLPGGSLGDFYLLAWPRIWSGWGTRGGLRTAPTGSSTTRATSTPGSTLSASPRT